MSPWTRLDDEDMSDAIDELRNPQQAKDGLKKYLKEEVFKMNFYRAHMLYFILVIGITSVIVYGEGLANGPGVVGGSHLTYMDALFLCCSAMTTTGN
jgi:1-acyl-sn-glycerol-3-phosphate acyltransferase